MKAKFITVLVLGGLFVTASKTYAWNQPPVAGLTVDPEYVMTDVNVTCDGSASYDPDGNIKKYEWDFDYNGVSFDCNYWETDACHPDENFDGITENAYSSVGVYTVKLIVTDNGSATDDVNCTVYVGRAFNINKNKAYSSIQAAIDAADAGNLIKVSRGTCSETVDFKGVNCTVTSLDPNDRSVVAATVINANGADWAVKFGLGEGTSCVLKGFTITGGGRGIYCDNSSEPTISNCIIRDNDYSGDGGGMYCNGASPAISNCRIINNKAGNSSNGGGMYCGNSSEPTIKNCVFSKNIATGDGGGMHNTSSDPNVINCIFGSNDARGEGDPTPWGEGGGIDNENSSPRLINCTFSKNTAKYGGGMANEGNSSKPIVSNCIFWGNQAKFDGDEIDNYHEADPNFSYCDVNGCGGSGNWNTYFGTNGGGNIDDDPYLVDALNPAGADGVFGTWDDGLRIMAYSPCVDRADSSADGFEPNDITGQQRVDVPYVDNNGIGEPNYGDIGAYESPVVWFVDMDVNDSNDGSSWDEAFEHLRDALATAKDGNEIWVAVGTYKPTSDSNRAVSFELVEDVGVYGGFAGEMSGPQRRGWTGYNKTVLSGDINEPNDANDNSYHVVKGADNAVLDGFTITGGYADSSYPNNEGGGIYCYRTSPTISNCVITDNQALTYGGGMCNEGTYNDHSKPTITNCFFIGNKGSGGGMANYYADSVLTSCVFSGNETLDRGHGAKGGAIRNVTVSSMELINCTLSKNTAVELGGGIDGGSNSTLTNCIFWGNTDQGGENHDEPAQIYGGTPTVTYSCIQDANADDANIPFGGAAAGNIDSDPCFVDAGDPDGNDNILGTWDDGLRLKPDSNCIDAADGEAAPSFDIRGFGRVDINDVNNTGRGYPNYADIGAYEFPREPAVHFTGIFIGGKYIEDVTEEAFVDDGYSDILGHGSYPSTSTAIPNADSNTLDCIAISEGTRLIIYSDTNDIVLDKTGPAVIYNVWWIDDDRYNWVIDSDWPVPLQTEFPRSVREWSDPNKGDMRGALLGGWLIRDRIAINFLTMSTNLWYNNFNRLVISGEKTCKSRFSWLESQFFC